MKHSARACAVKDVHKVHNAQRAAWATDTMCKRKHAQNGTCSGHNMRALFFKFQIRERKALQWIII